MVKQDRCLNSQLPHMYDALFEITDDSTLRGSSGTISKVEAEGLLNSISSFKFVVAVVTWHSILFQINLTSKLLQEKHFTLEKTVNELKNTEEYLKNMRSGVEFPFPPSYLWLKNWLNIDFFS